MYKITFPNDVPWIPNMAVLGSTSAAVFAPKERYTQAEDKDDKIFAVRMHLAATVTTRAIYQMMEKTENEEKDDAQE